VEEATTVTTSAPLVVLEILSASVWIGSLVCLAVVSQAARQVLQGPAQAAFFRAVGRRYAIVGTGSLLVAIGTGLAMAWPPATWSGTIDAAVALAGLLVLATAAGMAQARAMGTLRRRAIASPADGAAVASLHRGRRLATSLRLLMAADTLAIVVLAAVAVSH
jgi:uncharacterized membrane protein